MESERFDRLTRGASEQASRRGVMRAGIGALAGVALASLGLGGEDAEAKKKRKKKLVCLNGQTKKVRNRKRFLRRNPTATAGQCIVPAQQCTAAVPVSCDPNGNWCCPNELPTCCPNRFTAGFACNEAGTVCCGTEGEACSSTAEQCCPGSGNDDFGIRNPYCAGASDECCPWDSEGACGPGEQCCAPDLTSSDTNQVVGCVPEGTVCCPWTNSVPNAGYCDAGDFCCPANATDPGRCCPAFPSGEFTGGCCDSAVSDSCPTGWTCSTGIGFQVGCCIPEETN